MSLKSASRRNKRKNFRATVLAWQEKGFTGNIIILA